MQARNKTTWRLNTRAVGWLHRRAGPETLSDTYIKEPGETSSSDHETRRETLDVRRGRPHAEKPEHDLWRAEAEAGLGRPGRHTTEEGVVFTDSRVLFS